MKEIDLINSLLNNTAGKKGVLKKEQDYFNSFSDEINNIGKAELKEERTPFLKFDAVNNDFNNHKTRIIKLAAQTTNSITHLKPKFYISSDDKFAIKIITKNNEYHCSVITNVTNPLNELLVYCEELDDYFVTNNEGQFALTNISGLDLDNLNFNFIIPFLSINLYRINDYFHLISEFDTRQLSLLEDDVYVIIKFQPDTMFNKVVLKNDGLKNIISYNNNGLKINKKLLTDKNTLLFY
jgi:hypothetical protein